MSTIKTNDRLAVPLIGAMSVIIPAAVAALLFVDMGDSPFKDGVTFLPTLNAIINTTVSILLILGLVFIRRRQIALHRFVMLTAFFLSIVFLVSYIIYHYAHGDVKYGGTGGLKVTYLLILFTHIACSMAVVPLALFAIYRGLSGQVEKHRRIVKYTWPIWLYVSITGVVVYLFAHVFNPTI